MSGGRFDITTGRIRPGTYINVDANENTGVLKKGVRGRVVIPLIAFGWGEDRSFVEIKAKKINDHYAELGDYVDNIVPLREAFKGCSTVIAYISNKGNKATVTEEDLTVTAKYPGTRGNHIKLSSIKNSDNTFDVTVYMDTTALQTYSGLSTIADLKDADPILVDISGTGALTAFASISLAGGVTTASTNADITNFLDDIESVKFNAVALPFTEAAIKTSCISKIKYLRDDMGYTIQGVLPSADANYEGVINVTNGVVLEDGTSLQAVDCCAFVAGITAGASELESNTFVKYEGAESIIGNLTNEGAEQAILNGELFFSYADDGSVQVEYDINSLKTFTKTRSQSYRKNKIIRVIDAIQDAIKASFPPNKFTNDNIGWDTVEGLGKVLLKEYEGEGAITEVNTDEDFLVDREKSSGDSMYINVGIKPVDMAEKLYFTVTTR